MVRTIVILGANVAGVPIAHYLAKRTAPKVPGGLKIILVSPNTHMYWVFASVRGIIPGLFPDEKMFLPIAPAFSKYSKDVFEFVVGKAEQLDPSKSTVVVKKSDGEVRTITYDDVIITTGSSFKGGLPFKNLSSTEETKEVLHDWGKRIKSAQSIVVAGAGYTGVELAGELGSEYGGKKQLTLIADDTLPLADTIMKATRETAKKELEKLGVKVITNARVTRFPETSNGAASGKTPAPSGTIEITVGASKEKKTLNADVFIPTFGVVPNTSFLPEHMLDANGFAKQTKYLRAEGYDNVFVVGDAGNFQPPKGGHADQQIQHVVKILEVHLLGQGTEPEYVPDPKPMIGVTLGRNRGTGQMGNWKPWSFMIWWFKGRYHGTDYAQDFVNGLRTVTLTKGW